MIFSIMDALNEDFALRQACAFTAGYWGQALRQSKIGLPKLDETVIRLFELTLEEKTFIEIKQVEFDPEDPDLGSRCFQRWVGCLDYHPTLYLAEAAYLMQISPLYFPARMGWYVNPGRVINGEGVEKRV